MIEFVGFESRHESMQECRKRDSKCPRNLLTSFQRAINWIALSSIDSLIFPSMSQGSPVLTPVIFSLLYKNEADVAHSKLYGAAQRLTANGQR